MSVKTYWRLEGLCTEAFVCSCRTRFGSHLLGNAFVFCYLLAEHILPVQLWLGYQQSVRPLAMGLTLNVDTSASAFQKTGPLINFMLESCRGSNKKLLTTNGFSDDWRLKYSKVIGGLRVSMPKSNNASTVK